MVATGVARAYDVQETLTMPPNNLGIVGWWTFDGPTINGTTVTDVSGQGDNGTMVNSPPPVAGVEGQELSLNGSNQYINCGTNDLAFNFASTSSFTESVWAYPTRVNGSWQAVFQVGRNLGLGNYQGIWLSGSNQWVFGSAGGGNLGTVYATPNKWVNITVVHTATSKAIYINGVLNTTGAGDAIAGDQGGALCGIGSWTQEYFAGSVDDMRVYNRALSPYEIKQIYNAGTATHQNATVNPPNLQNGLVAHWTFDGPTISGTTVADVSGNGNTGTMVNGPAASPGVEGQALSFNGTSQYVAGAVTTTSQQAYSAVTVSGWVRFSSLSGVQEIVGRSNGSTNQYQTAGTFGIDLNVTGSGEMGFHFDDGTDRRFSTNFYPTAGRWIFFTGTYDSSSNKVLFYVNGVQTLSTSAAGIAIPTDSSALFQLGWWQPPSAAFYLNGSIDDVRIYNRALSAAEVQQLYDLGTANHQNATVNPPNLQGGLVGHWTFDGPTISGTTVKDVSGSGNNGTMEYNPTPVAGVLGQALSFNGTSQYVSLLSGTNLNANTNQGYSVSGWFKTAGLYGPIVALRSSVSGQGIFGIYDGYDGLTTSAGQVKFLMWTNTGTVTDITGPAIDDGKWHSLVAERDSTGVMRLYLDGVLSVTGGGSAQSGPMTFNEPGIGADINWINSGFGPASERYFNGTIDDVRIYNRALSASEVKQLYVLGR